MERPYPAQIPQIQPDEKSTADNILIWNKSPIATIQTVVTIITHHEILPGRYFADKALAVITAILAMREVVRMRHISRSASISKYAMRPISQLFRELLGIAQGFFIQIIRLRRIRHRA